MSEPHELLVDGTIYAAVQGSVTAVALSPQRVKVRKAILACMPIATLSGQAESSAL